MLCSASRMCISKGTHSSGKHFTARKAKKVKNTETEKQSASDLWFAAAFHAWQLGLAEPRWVHPRHPCRSQWVNTTLRSPPEATPSRGTKQKGCGMQFHLKHSHHLASSLMPPAHHHARWLTGFWFSPLWGGQQHPQCCWALSEQPPMLTR